MTDLTRISFELTHERRRLRIVLRGGRGNVIDSTMALEILGVLRQELDGKHLRCVAVEADGDHFSFGASVPEHSPEQVRGLLSALDSVALGLLHSPVPATVAVRGACLGGGLEVVLPCHRVFAAPGAKLGLPEVTLGMFAPVGSAMLPERVGRGLAEEMLLTGRVLTSEEGLAAGLVDEVSKNPEGSALRWFEEKLLPRSASALRFATRAARASMIERVESAALLLERLFTEDTMRTRDAVEGIASFTAKRDPVWVDA